MAKGYPEKRARDASIHCPTIGDASIPNIPNLKFIFQFAAEMENAGPGEDSGLRPLASCQKVDATFWKNMMQTKSKSGCVLIPSKRTRS